LFIWSQKNCEDFKLHVKVKVVSSGRDYRIQRVPDQSLYKVILIMPSKIEENLRFPQNTQSFIQ